jgi:hypothetical protein
MYSSVKADFNFIDLEQAGNMRPPTFSIIDIHKWDVVMLGTSGLHLAYLGAIYITDPTVGFDEAYAECLALGGHGAHTFNSCFKGME